jgi:hypothetical protein
MKDLSTSRKTGGKLRRIELRNLTSGLWRKPSIIQDMLEQQFSA